MKSISIQGARTHNLKNISIDIPRDQLICITGLSGSGKSSLAFDTLYAEGQRRYVESLSAYARQFLSLMEKPDVDNIEGLSPAISIEQKSTSHNPRSTVGTITEIYDYLRLLFARVGEPKCPEHQITLKAKTISEMVDSAVSYPKNTKLMLLAPVIRNRKGEHLNLLKNLYSQGYLRARIDGEIYELDQPPELDLHKKHTIEVVVDRFKSDDNNPDLKQRLAESFETALELTGGLASVSLIDPKDLKSIHSNNINNFESELLFSQAYACPECGYSLNELAPRLFSFNSPMGACQKCDGLGVMQSLDLKQIVNKSMSLNQGAFRTWNKGNPYFYLQIMALSEFYKIDLDTPFEDLDPKHQNILLYGSGDQEIKFTLPKFNGGEQSKVRPFEGVINNFNRRFKEAESETVRKSLGRLMAETDCESCHGTRLNPSARNVFVNGKNISEVCKHSISECLNYFENLKLTGARAKIAEKVLKEIQDRLSFLVNVGLDYLNLSRSAGTLSGGEAQRIRLASQIGAGLVGVMYVLDEPSIGLHQRDNQRLLDSLQRLKSLGNTVIMVEHDEDAIRQSDYVIDIGPGAGIHGGEVICADTPENISKNKHSITGKYLSGREKIEVPQMRKIPDNKTGWLKIKKAQGNNLKNIDLKLPIGFKTCITGVSGSGKSTLINQTLYPLVANILNRNHSLSPMAYEKIEGLSYLDKVVDINQSPIGRTPRSNPATYVGVFTSIRELFANTQESRARGYKPGRFSFNVKGGRCEACQGDGVIKVEMHFLPDVYVQCDHCKGKRYNRETLDILYKGKNIHQVLDMSIEEAHHFFEAVPSIKLKLDMLEQVGLGYIQLGQRATTLSGGEAQRVKLAKELSKRDTGRTLYILDEPTTGLHFHDVKLLLTVIDKLQDRGNTIVIIEHNLDVIKTADWIIDLGPEGGDGGGQIIAEGSPESVSKIKKSYTGQFLKNMI